MMRLRFVLLALMLLGACGCKAPVKPGPAAPHTPTAPVAKATPTPSGFIFELSEGTEVSQAGASPAAVPPTEPLTAEQVAALLSRLPAIKSEDGDRKPFAVREKSLPPPQTGETVKQSFPPPQTAETPAPQESGPLQVLRHQPDGKVPLAPLLSITFSQPMVPLTSHDDLAEKDVPIRLQPTPPGKWRWAGTRTLIFEPTPRFPMATIYTVTVPAGTKSATGGTLDKEARFTFQTPPLRLVSSFPNNGPQVRDPLMGMVFDQKIDPTAVLENTKATLSGGGTVSLRLATADEVAADPNVAAMASGVDKDRFVAFRSTSTLPTNTTVTITVKLGTPSVEGPLRTESDQSFSFSTYAPLRMTDHNCRSSSECSPGSPLVVSFNNALDAKLFQKSMVTVAPAIKGMRVGVSGNNVMVTGMIKGRTTYVMTIDPNLTDVYGQTLESQASATFYIGSASDSLQTTGGAFVVLDPSGKPSWPVYSMNRPNFRITAYSVTPDDWAAFGKYLQQWNADQPAPPPGKQVMSQVVETHGTPDELTETDVDLLPALPGGLGQLVVVVEPTEQPPEHYRRQKYIAWVEATRIGLDAAVDHTKMVAWATALTDGRPLSGVQLTISGAAASATTDGSGVANLELPTTTPTTQSAILIARKDDDVAILPESPYGYGGYSWVRHAESDQLRWYVFDDRRMYRPAEEVHVKGWARLMAAGPKGDLSIPKITGSEELTWQLMDSRGNKVLEGKTKIDAMGGFDLSFKLPKTMNLGSGTLMLASSLAGSNASTTHGILVQEFRRPEFEVSASSSDGPFIIGESGDMAVNARYYAGGGLPGAPVNWTVNATEGYFSPPGRSEFTFGTWTPWWLGYDYEGPRGRPYYGRGRAMVDEEEMGVPDSGGIVPTKTFSGRTDSNGKHHLHIAFTSVRPPHATTLSAQATVQDVNRQAWTARTSMLVHPAALYVGMKADKLFMQPGEKMPVQIVVCDLDGKAVPDTAVHLRLWRTEYAWETGSIEETQIVERDKKSGGDPIAEEFELKEGGQYHLSADIQDAKGRKNRSEIQFWVAGGKQIPQRGVQKERVTLIPDKKDYQPGDSAKILVQSPFPASQGLLTVRRNDIVETRAFALTEGSATIEVAITEDMIPNVHLEVDTVGAAPRTDDNGKTDDALPKRPAFAGGQLDLSVPPLTRTLAVKAVPKALKLDPGGETDIDVDVKDAAGNPVADSQVAVVVVDEAVLALSSYKLTDPISIFYPRRADDVREWNLRANVQLNDPTKLAGDGAPGAASGGGANDALQARASNGPVVAAPSAAAAAKPAAQAAMAKSEVAKDARDEESGEQPADSGPIKVRSDFNPLALFAPAVSTDASGHATAHVKLPDNLTRYRVMAVAVGGGKQFGMGENSLTARLPLMVRPSAPRFLNFGDTFELPVVLQNQTDKPMTVQVAVRASNAKLTAGDGRRVVVPANDRVEVRFPSATIDAGTARFQFAASGVDVKGSDAAEVSLPVWTPATSEAFAVYGVVDDGGVTQPVQAPSKVFPQFGGLEVTTSSTQLQALTDAAMYLVRYPFECGEQVSSRVLAVAALKDVLSAFKAEGMPTPDKLIPFIGKDIEKLRALQCDDGGFALWNRNELEWPYVTVHVTHALVMADKKGFTVPKDVLERAQGYLKTIETHFTNELYTPEVRRTIVAYSLYVRHLMGDDDYAKAQALIKEAGGVDKMPAEALGWLLMVMSKHQEAQNDVVAIRTYFANHVTEEAGTAQFTTHYDEGSSYLLFASDRRTDAIVLEALIEDSPKNDVIPKIVRGLLDHRVRGHWENTQEDTFILLALDRYFNTYENVTPDFVARIWLGKDYAGEHKYKGRTTEKHDTEIPMDWLMKTSGPQNLVLTKTGPGRLYYRLGMTYAPSDLRLGASEHGFSVERTYQAVDNPDDVRHNADGKWEIKAGARVRVSITMVAPARRYHVALVDPLPAGLEAVNPALAVSGTDAPRSLASDSAGGPGRRYYAWSGGWYEHQNLRDERAEAFCSLLWDGVYTYDYVARATTPGEFVAPPSKAEEMYHPETFGRGATDIVIVK